MKWKFVFLLVFPSFCFSATATYYAYDDTRFPQHQSFWSFFSKAPVDKSVVPEEMVPYLRDKSLRSGSYVLVKPLFENEVAIFSDGPYYATVWRSGTSVHNETKVLSELLKQSKFKAVFDNLDYKFFRLPIYTPLNTAGGPVKFYVYQMPGFSLNINHDCTLLMQLVKKIGYTGDAFGCVGNYFQYIPVYSYKDIKHIGTRLN